LSGGRTPVVRRTDSCCYREEQIPAVRGLDSRLGRRIPAVGGLD